MGKELKIQWVQECHYSIGINLKYQDYKIGEAFYTNAGKWRCTDIGTRVVIAISLDQNDERNYNGPPYSVQEVVFDEYDFESCFTKNERDNKTE